jgi:hypothetical protein
MPVPVFNFEKLACRTSPGTGRNFNISHRSNARKGFSTEAKGTKRKHIFETCYLAGGMTFERERQVFTRDAVTVIGYPDKFEAAAFDFNRYLR